MFFAIAKPFHAQPTAAGTSGAELWGKTRPAIPGAFNKKAPEKPMTRAACGKLRIGNQHGSGAGGHRRRAS
jgi:hypothetical protein